MDVPAGLLSRTGAKAQGLKHERGIHHGVRGLGGRLWCFLNGRLPGVATLGLCRSPLGAGASRRMPRSGTTSRLTGVSEISSSLISSHCASVRSLSGIANSSCRRRRGEFGCGSFMAARVSIPVGSIKSGATCHILTHDGQYRAASENSTLVSAVFTISLDTFLYAAYLLA